MGFELRVVRNIPLTGEKDLDRALLAFLDQIGYLPDGNREDAAFGLFRDCFLLNPERPWTIDELLTVLDTNKSTLYRYLNKLKGLDILDEIDIPAERSGEEGSYRKTKKGYRFRFQSLSTAWGIVESHTDVALQGYRASVDHLQVLAKSRLKNDGDEGPRGPALTVDGIVLRELESKREILLVRRGNEPYKGLWALPGGFVDYGEKLEDAVVREIKEETGLDCGVVRQSVVASRPDRDPRGHTVSVVFEMAPVDEDEPAAGDDASEAVWFDMDDLPEMAFDHRELIEKTLLI